MGNQFDLVRYKELLEFEKNNEITIFDSEVITYHVSISSQIRYNRKEKYFSLIEKYLKGNVNGHDFRSKFPEMEKEDNKRSHIIQQDFQKLETFTLADDLEDFSKLIVKISMLCVDYYIIWTGETENMPESQFYSLVNKYYFQLAKSFSSISTKNLPYEKLISRSFRNLAGILV